MEVGVAYVFPSLEQLTDVQLSLQVLTQARRTSAMASVYEYTVHVCMQYVLISAVVLNTSPQLACLYPFANHRQ